VQNIHNVLFALNKVTKGAINITVRNDMYSIQTPFDGSFMRMADKFQGKVNKDKTEVLMMRSLYNLGGTQFVFPEMAIKGTKTYKSNGDYKDKTTDDALILKVKNQGREQTITLVGSKGQLGEPQIFKQGDLEFTVFYLSKLNSTSLLRRNIQEPKKAMQRLKVKSLSKTQNLLMLEFL
jgi:hypothetical protein